MSCLGFVFAAMLEFAAVLLLPILQKTSAKENVEKELGGKQWATRNLKLGKQFAKIKTQIREPTNLEIYGFSNKQNIQFEMIQKRLDNIAFLTFGISFVAFNLVYWVYYLV